MRRRLVGVAVLGAAGLFATPISLTLDTSGIPSFQQTVHGPCIFGTPSCVNGTFPMTTLPEPGNADYDITSVTYSVGQIRGVVGNTFLVAIDLGQSRGAPNHILELFTLSIGTSVEFQFQNISGSGVLFVHNPGSGFSDAFLTGFNLSAFEDVDQAIFGVRVTNASAPREQFFLIGVDNGGGGGAVIPEPSTYLIVGAGLIGLAAYRRRSLRRG